MPKYTEVEIDSSDHLIWAGKEEQFQEREEQRLTFYQPPSQSETWWKRPRKRNSEYTQGRFVASVELWNTHFLFLVSLPLLDFVISCLAVEFSSAWVSTRVSIHCSHKIDVLYIPCFIIQLINYQQGLINDHASPHKK